MTLDLYLTAVIVINAYFLVTVLSNIVYFHRATRPPRIRSGPFVSVIVPARNEERAIARCLGSLLRQDYADFEVIVVDDESTDGTARIVDSLGARDPRVRLVTGAPLPEGWLGKPHALSQGAAVARGEILLLTDADSVHEPTSVSWAVTNLQDHKADMLSGYIGQEYGSFGERVIVPTMYAMMLLVPLFLLPRTKSSQLSFAIGQYVAMRREALEGVGGYEAIKDSIVDDISMATRMKQFGYRNVFLDASDVAACRLYSGYRDAFRGIERSIYSAVGGDPLAVLAMATIVVGFILGPAASVLLSALHFEAPAAPILMAVVLFAVQWAFVAWDRSVPLTAVILYPLVFLNLIVILTASMMSTGFGRGVDWKGRTIRTPGNPGGQGETRLEDVASKSGKVR